MANLLPQKEKKSLEANYRARFILIGALVLLSTAAVAALSLLPSYLVLASAQPQSPSVNIVASDKATIQEVQRAQALTRELLPIFAASSTPSQLVAKVLTLRPKGITIEHMTYTAGSLILVGSAENREEINAYQTILRTDPQFASVSIPVGALVGSEGNHFTVTLTGTF